MSKKEVRVYAHMDKESMYSVAIKAGLSEKSANYFMYFNEVPLDVTVNEETGEVIGLEIGR